MSASLALERTGPGRFRGATDERYWNQIGPFGGWLAALAAAALRCEAPAGWPLRAIAVQFLGRLPAGALDLQVETLRRQRRVAGLRATLAGAGDRQPAVSAEAVFGSVAAGAAAVAPSARRPPALPPASTLPRLDTLDPLAAFVRTFDHRVAFGLPFAGAARARSGGWLRSRLPLPSGHDAHAPSDTDGAPAAFEALLMLADAWFPPRWAALAAPMPVSTVSMQVVFHDAVPGPAHPGASRDGVLDGFLAACYEEEAGADGFGLERGALWWPDGRLALTTQQLTWIGDAAPRREEER